MKKTKIRNDVILVLLLFFAAALAFFLVSLLSKAGGSASVYVDGKLYGSYPLREDNRIEIKTDYGYNILVIEDGRADVVDADCKNQICVNTKAIEKSGETITCLPHKMTVVIESETDDGIDLSE